MWGRREVGVIYGGKDVGKGEKGEGGGERLA
jgi:hypothetical protein